MHLESHMQKDLRIEEQLLFDLFAAINSLALYFCQIHTTLLCCLCDLHNHDNGRFIMLKWYFVKTI